MGMYRAPGQNNMLTGQQSAYGSDPTRPAGLAKSSPSIARYPATGSPLVRQPAYQDPYANVIQQKLGQADQQPAAAQQMKQAAAQPMAAKAPSQGSEVPGVGMPPGAASMGKVSAMPGAQQAAAPMVPAMSAQQLQDMKQGAFKQMQTGPQQVMQGGPMYAEGGLSSLDTSGGSGGNAPPLPGDSGGNAPPPPGGDGEMKGLTWAHDHPKENAEANAKAKAGLESGVGLNKEDQDKLNQYTLDQILNSPYGIPEDVMKQKLASINQGLEMQAGADKQQAGFLMGSAGLAGSGMGVSALSDIDAKKMQAMSQAETTMRMDNAKMAQQEKMQRISDAIQMAQMQGNWDLAKQLQEEQIKYQEETRNLEYQLQAPQTINALKKEFGNSADWNKFMKDWTTYGNDPKMVQKMMQGWYEEDGQQKYKGMSERKSWKSMTAAEKKKYQDYANEMERYRQDTEEAGSMAGMNAFDDATFWGGPYTLERVLKEEGVDMEGFDPNKPF